MKKSLSAIAALATSVSLAFTTGTVPSDGVYKFTFGVSATSDGSLPVPASAKLEVRDAVLKLRSDESLSKTPEEALMDMAAGLSKGGAVKTRVKLRGLPRHMREGAYQDMMLIVREAVTNAIKHGRAKTVVITCDPSERGFVLKVLNDGVKFDAKSALGPDSGHFGLSGMRERAARSGFSLEFVNMGRWCGIALEVPATEGKQP